MKDDLQKLLDALNLLVSRAQDLIRELRLDKPSVAGGLIPESPAHVVGDSGRYRGQMWIKS
ncbi:MAG: hypothetical protein K0B01_11580 [Syntrophobacterales bacterium]|nr:hypothetical protein [Syntrophobacterales bacterium]